MMIALLEFEVDDDFKRGDCNDCPISHFDSNFDLVCPMYLNANECKIKIKKEGEKNEQQTKNRHKRH